MGGGFLEQLVEKDGVFSASGMRLRAGFEVLLLAFQLSLAFLVVERNRTGFSVACGFRDLAIQYGVIRLKSLPTGQTSFASADYCLLVFVSKTSSTYVKL